MKLLRRIFTRETAGTDVLRLVVCAILFTHGAYRLYHGDEARGLGKLLHEEGFPVGVLLVYLVCLAETGGTILLAMRLLVLPVSLILSLIYVTGILLFHGPSGFFVVGPGENGWEYSALLITCLLVTAWKNRAAKFF
jgi:putative oxidoreductase